LPVIAWGSLFASYCYRVTFKLRLRNLLVELGSLQKSAEETRHETRRDRSRKGSGRALMLIFQNAVWMKCVASARSRADKETRKEPMELR